MRRAISLDATVEAMLSAKVVVATDSGLAHLAILCGRPLILISDGEEHETDYPVAAARAAYDENGIIICTVGIGDVREGARIPIVENGQRTFLKYDGQEVWSKMVPVLLQEMAVVGGGMYLPAETGDFDLGTVYDWIRDKLDVVEFEAQYIERYHARFQWLAGIALLLVVAETLMTDRRRRDKGTEP